MKSTYKIDVVRADFLSEAAPALKEVGSNQRRMNLLLAQLFPVAGAGQSDLLHSLVAVMLWAVLQAELTVPLMGGSVLNPISSFRGHSPVGFLKL